MNLGLPSARRRWQNSASVSQGLSSSARRDNYLRQIRICRICLYVCFFGQWTVHPVLGTLGSAQCRSTNQYKSALVLSMCCNMAISRCSNVRNANIADFEIKACRSGSGVNSGNFSSENFWIFLGSPKAFRSCRY